MSISVIVPVFNEEKIIEKNLIAFEKKISKIIGNKKWELVIVENGSSDNTFKKLCNLKKKIKHLKLERLSKSNYGKSLKKGCLISKYEFGLILNIDHLWDDIFFKWAWKYKNLFDVIIASKRSDPFLNNQSKYRKILSSSLNLILNFFLDSVLADTHGMKLLNLKNLKKEIIKCQLSRGQFDTELMLRLSRKSYRIAEVPIPYIEQRSPKNFMFRKIFQNLFDLFKLIKILNKIKINKTINYRRYSREDLKKMYV